MSLSSSALQPAHRRSVRSAPRPAKWACLLRPWCAYSSLPFFSSRRFNRGERRPRWMIVFDRARAGVESSRRSPAGRQRARGSESPSLHAESRHTSPRGPQAKGGYRITFELPSSSNHPRHLMLQRTLSGDQFLVMERVRRGHTS